LLPTRCPLVSHLLPTCCPLAAHSFLTCCPLVAHLLPTCCPPVAHLLPTRCRGYLSRKLHSSTHAKNLQNTQRHRCLLFSPERHYDESESGPMEAEWARKMGLQNHPGATPREVGTRHSTLHPASRVTTGRTQKYLH
jgi:hypothetical protein